MMILSWNCRGLAAAATIRELKDLSKKQRPSILFLMETRARRASVDNLRIKLGYQHSHVVEPIGLSGGLCLIWNRDVEIEVMEESQNFIHTIVTSKHDIIGWQCTFVYGDPNPRRRKDLWDNITTLHLRRSNPWCCVGDFNEILHQHEKDGLRPQANRRIAIFRNFLNTTELLDMNLKGAKFTWQSNPRHGFVTREKIDRVLVNWAWRSKYPHAIAHAHPTVSSDHAIIMLDPKPQKKSGRAFRYEAFWDNREDCKKTVMEGWNNSNGSGSTWEDYEARSKACKRHLISWQKNTFSAADKEITKLKQELAYLNDRPHNDIDWMHVAALKTKINQLWKQEEMYWGMRSRIKWAKWGGQKYKVFPRHHGSKERDQQVREAEG